MINKSFWRALVRSSKVDATWVRDFSKMAMVLLS